MSARMDKPWSSDLRERVLRAAAPVAAFLLVGALVVVGSRAAFSATTDNASNSWSAGTVVLSDDDTGSAMFNVTGMKPGGAANVKCITVTYSGTLTPADVKLYGTVAGTGLATYLTTTVEIGTGGTFGNCSGFTSGSTIYSGTLANFTSTYTNWASGLANWSPASNPDSRTLRFTTSLPSGTGNAAQGLSASATFTWEAQNQ